MFLAADAQLRKIRALPEACVVECNPLSVGREGGAVAAIGIPTRNSGHRSTSCRNGPQRKPWLAAVAREQDAATVGGIDDRAEDWQRYCIGKISSRQQNLLGDSLAIANNQLFEVRERKLIGPRGPGHRVLLQLF